MKSKLLQVLAFIVTFLVMMTTAWAKTPNTKYFDVAKETDEYIVLYPKEGITYPILQSYFGERVAEASGGKKITNASFFYNLKFDEFGETKIRPFRSASDTPRKESRTRITRTSATPDLGCHARKRTRSFLFDTGWEKKAKSSCP